MRRLLIAGNWKMNGSLKMTSELISEIGSGLEKDVNFEVLVCPPSVYLDLAQRQRDEIGKIDSLKLGAQNVNAQANGAFTGEHSLEMLTEFGCEYVLLGHSERREYYGESDNDVAEKFEACIAADRANTKPILCLGETLAQRQADETEAVINKQLDAVLNRVGVQGFSNALIAYEPVWAIGTGETATPEQAQAVHKFVRAKLANLDAEIASELRILYGGSMKPSNARELLSQDDIDGGLIGGASLNAESFLAICEAAASIMS